MKKILAVLLLAGGLMNPAVQGQLTPGAARRIVGGTLPATCNAGPPADVWVASGVLYLCTATNTWTAVGASTLAFSSITAGTNTAALVVGTGGSLTVSGTGTINATTLLSSTWASPAAIGTGTPAAGTFTTVVANTSVSTAGSLTTGSAGGVTGTVALSGSVSGTATITAQATAGTPTLTLPNTSGTFAVTAAAPLTLSATTGGITWSGTSGGVPYFSSATTAASSGALTAHGVVIGGGAGTAPTATAAGTSGQCLMSNGAASDPTYQTCSSASSAAASNVTPVTANANTTSDQILQEVTLSAAYLNVAAQPVHIHFSGIFSVTGVPTVAHKLKLCTVSGCGSGTVITLSTMTTTATVSAASNQYVVDLDCLTHTTGASGKLICHGILPIDQTSGATTATAFTDANTAASSTIDLTAALFLSDWVAFSSGSASNTDTSQLAYVAPLSTPNATSINDSAVVFTDITTGNVSSTKHGYAPKAPNDATKFLDGTGAYSVPSGGTSYTFRDRLRTTSTTIDEFPDPAIVRLADNFQVAYGGYSSGLIGQLGWSSSSGTLSRQSGVWPNLGIFLRSTTGATNTNISEINLTASDNNFFGAIGNNTASFWESYYVFRLNSTTSEALLIGFSGNVYPQGANEGFGVRYDTGAGDTNYMAVSCTSSVCTAASLGVAADTSWHTIRMFTDGATSGKISVSIDGGTAVAICSGCAVNAVPTTSASIGPHVNLETLTNATRSVDVNFFAFNARVSATSGKRN